MSTHTAPAPTPADIQQLLDFQPLLDALPPGRIARRSRAAKGELPPMGYAPVVVAFFEAAAAECWSDHGYRPAEAGAQLRQPGFVEQASMQQLRSLLTFCVRGERFSDGHWGAMVREGHIHRLLQRLAALR